MINIPTLDQVLVRLEGQVATVTLNRPQLRNPLSVAMLGDLRTALSWARSQESVRAVVLTGAGDRAFCAGADLAAFETGVADLARGLVDLFALIEELGKPMIGRINGHALAGGFGLACACDLLVAAEGATFGTPEIRIGIWPLTILPILERNLPRKLVLEMAMLGGRWTAAQLRDAGLINRVVPPSRLDAVTYELADRLAEGSPAAMRLGRDAFYHQQDMDLAPALHYLSEQLVGACQTEDAREGIRAFLEKRAPEFRGR